MVRGSVAAVTFSLFVGCAGPAPERSGADDGTVDPVTAAEPHVTIEYLAHASFVVTGPDGSRVLIDPYQSRVWLGYDFPTGVTADAVLVTHPHYDHDAGVFRGAEFPWPDTRAIRDPGLYAVGSIDVEGVEGKHADPYGMEFGQVNTIFILDVAGIRIAHLGDNGPLTEANLSEMGDVDVLMIPGDGVYHILSPDATEAAIEGVDPRIVIPMHYRIGALELAAENPDDLGDVDPWLEGRGPVVYQTSNRVVLEPNVLPTQREYWVLPHSPSIAPPT